MNFLRTERRRRRRAAAAEPAVCDARRLRAVRRRHGRPVPARRRRRTHLPRRRDSPRQQLHGGLRAGRLEAARQPDASISACAGTTIRNSKPRRISRRASALSWSVTPKTVVRGNFGIYYDQFRLGLARNVPAYGGTDQRNVQYMVFPAAVLRLAVVRVEHRAVERPAGRLLLQQPRRQPDRRADHGAVHVPCPGRSGGAPFIGVDRLNNVVAPGRSPIPANTVVTRRQRPDADGADAAAVCGPGERRDWTAAGVFRVRPDRPI